MERAVRIYKYGPPAVLTIEPVEVPLPGPGEARIRHTAIGLNFVEVYFRRGTFQVPAFPAVLGNEGAGVVEATRRDDQLHRLTRLTIEGLAVALEIRKTAQRSVTRAFALAARIVGKTAEFLLLGLTIQ